MPYLNFFFLNHLGFILEIQMLGYEKLLRKFYPRKGITKKILFTNQIILIFGFFLTKDN